MTQYQPSLFGRPIPPPEPPLIGYALTADNPDKSKEFSTFMMARTVEDAIGYCVDYFPLEEGFIHLKVRGIVDARYNDIQPITRTLMSNEYIGKDGALETTVDNLTPERRKELFQHVPGCEICLQDCSDCWEFYSNVGHDEYVQVLTSKHGMRK